MPLYNDAAVACRGDLVVSSRDHLFPHSLLVLLLRRPESRPTLVLYVLGNAPAHSFSEFHRIGGLPYCPFGCIHLERHPKI